MDKILDRVIRFFENKSIHFGLRTSLFIISIFVLFVSDYYFDFTYDIHLNNKIEKLESINRLKKIYESDSLKLTELTELENRIYKRKHYSDRLRNLDLNQINIFKKSETTEIKSPVIKNDKTIINKPIRSVFWMVISSNYTFAIMLPVLILLPLFSKDARKKNAIVGWIAALIVIGIFGAITTWISYQIPLISENPTWNYVINFIIHTIFLILFIKLGNDKNKKTNANTV